ncbi:putative glycoside hydrolase [Methanobrevibacter sp. V74]|uniref:putative glycoside hydrolase n=1 Tax=Methanobrevibacter sp. V74 TaxID=3064279 RepID=UPI00273772A6|nr:putative glycoside hydrolase [Methanobrevibacter sp. V74]
MKNKTLILSIVLILFFMIGAVSAVNETDVVDSPDDSLDDEVLLDNQREIQTTIKSNNTNIVKGNDFIVQLTDENSTPVANKSVQFTLDSQVTNVTTDENGTAKLKILKDVGKYTVKYSFSSDGYAGCENSTKIFVIPTSASKILASNYNAYIGIKNKYTVCLTVGDVPLSGREIVFKIDGKKYIKKTNRNGRASLNIEKPKGTYNICCYYYGEDNIDSAKCKAKVKVIKGIPTKIKKENSVIYRHKKADYLKVKLYDARGNLLKSKKVTFKVNGKTYIKKTNGNGIAKVKIKLKTGTYKVKAIFKKTSIYNKTSKTIKIKVKPKQARNNGMWLLSIDMGKVNFTSLKKISTKHIFLNSKCIERFGKKYVESWIKTAKSKGIKVHLWMQVFYNSDGGWVNPIKNGKINHKLIDKKVKEAKKYAKIKGVSGVHFDYLRFPGTAYKYKNAVKAVNLFTKKATKEIHKVNKKIIVSAAVMPEPSSMKTYYGQDISTMGKYLDIIVPMVYKGNYHANSKWIKSVTKSFSKKSAKAKIWTGLQTYKSDSNIKKISAKELMRDADAAALGGAYGVILFRYGLINYIDFAEV